MAEPPLRGLLVDFGGVLTTDIFASFEAFCRAEGLEPDTVKQRFLSDPAAFGLLARLETGELTEEQFEPQFAALLEVESARLIDRLFGGMVPDEPMVEAVAAAKRAGIRTGLLSNSWGSNRYDRSRFPELFDATVISGEIGLRKPDPAIYELALERLELAAAEVVFVDDLPGNLKPARDLGFVTLHHRSAEETLPALERLLSVPLR